MNNIPGLKLHQETADQFNRPMKVYLLFNKVTDAFFMWVGYHETHGFDNEFKIAVCESFNPAAQSIVGDYNTWKVVDKESQPSKIHEVAIDKGTSDEILARYSFGKQLNTISEALLSLATMAGLNNTQEIKALESQLSDIKDLIENGNRRKEGFKKDPGFDYVSKEMQAKLDNKRYEGGIGELTGPRQVL